MKTMKHMLHHATSALCAAILLSSASLLITPSAHALDIGSPVRFAAMTTSGQPRQGSDYQGRLLVVHFWASWHPPSVAHFETLLHTIDNTAARGVRLLGVCLDDLDDRPGADAVFEHFAYAFEGNTHNGPARWEHTFSRLQTPPMDTRFFDEPYAIPSCWIVGPDGTALWQGHPAELPAELESLLGQYRSELIADVTPDETDDTKAADTLDAQTDPADAQPIIKPLAPDALEVAQKQADAAALSVEAAKAALLAAEDAREADPADYGKVLTALASIDLVAIKHPLIAAHGQRWKRLLTNLDADGQSALVAARDADPAAGLALDQFLMATADIDAMQGQEPADTTRVEVKMRGALRDQERERDMEAYDDFAWAVQVAAGTPAVDPALIGVLRYEADPAFMEQLAAAKAESDAQAKLFLAKGYVTGYKEEQAKVVLHEILEQYPDTETAKEAAAMLKDLP